MEKFFHVVLLLGVCSLVLMSSAEPILEIFPYRNPLLASIGMPLALMCSGKDDVDGEFTDLKWFDENGEEIPESSPNLKRFDSKLQLTFKDPKVADSGTYKCTALFSHTVEVEKEIRINFYEPIQFEDCPKVQDLVFGQEGRVNCMVTGNPTPSITWEKNQTSLKLDRISIDESGIVISSVSLQDAGTYSVEAFVKETGGNKIQEIEVNVLTEPKIIELPEEIILIHGEEYTINCEAIGAPPLSYHWYDPSMKDLSQVDGFRVEEGLLTITEVDRNAGGIYTCEVKNQLGTDSVTVKIEIQVRPTIVQLDNITREEGRDALFECKGNGVPSPKMSIRREKSVENIIDSPNDGIELEVTDEGPYKVLRLRIVNVQRSDGGLYYCKASNEAGTSVGLGRLEVQFRPDMNRTNSTKVKTLPGIPVNLSCIAEANPKATITWKFQGDPIEERDDRFIIFGGVTYSNLLVLTDNKMHFEVYGTYTCEARNSLGEASIKFTLEDYTVPGQIAQIIFDKVTSTSITFRLLGPSNTGGTPITHYIMRYKLDELPDIAMEVVEWQKDTPYILNNLIPGAKYQFSAAARNMVGNGPWKTENYIMPEETVPESPVIKTRPETVSQYPDAIQFEWDAPNDNGNPIQQYGIRYFNVERRLSDWYQIDKSVELSVSADTRYFKITGLVPDTYYKIEIRARNGIGNSLPSTVVLKTRGGTPKLSSYIFLLSLVLAASFLLASFAACLIHHRSNLVMTCKKKSTKSKA